eukprot:9472884-Pyramimonas_sp.AAC.1
MPIQNSSHTCNCSTLSFVFVSGLWSAVMAGYLAQTVADCQIVIKMTQVSSCGDVTITTSPKSISIDRRDPSD